MQQKCVLVWVTVTCNFELNRELKFATEIQSSILILPLQNSTVTTSDHRLHQPKPQRVRAVAIIQRAKQARRAIALFMRFGALSRFSSL